MSFSTSARSVRGALAAFGVPEQAVESRKTCWMPAAVNSSSLGPVAPPPIIGIALKVSR